MKTSQSTMIGRTVRLDASRCGKAVVSRSERTQRHHRLAALAAPLTGEQHQRIVIGEVLASREPLLLQTLLGSCVAVCLRDPVTEVGGMNHIFLPGDGNRDRSSRYGVQAMELLINGIMREGGDRRRLVAKAFGAGNVIAGLPSPTIGDQNAAFIRSFLETEKIPLLAERLGGTHAVQVYFRTDTGKAMVHSVDGSCLPAIVRTELTHRLHPADEDVGGEAVLF